MMTHLELAFLTLALCCLVFLPAILWVAIGIRRRIAATAHQQKADLAALASKLQMPAMDSMTEDMAEIRKGFDWLVTDRMISEAVEMARSGLSTPAIVSRTGISSAELAAITKCRNH
jgi:hypothetical protein